MKQTHITLPRGDARLAVRDSGGHLAPVVLVHGLGGSQLAFKRVVALLSDRARVITYDQRGHGASTISDRGDYSFPALIADLRAVVDHLELSHPVLVGHSLGAGVALCAAATIPDCGGLVALDGALPVRMPPPDRDRARRAARAPSLVLARALMRALRVGAALSIEQMQAIAEDLLTRGDEFEHALRSLACSARYLLGSRVGPGPDGAAALEAARMGARRVSEIDPAIEVAWLDTGHTMPDDAGRGRRCGGGAGRRLAHAIQAGTPRSVPSARLARAPAAAVTIAEKPAPWSSATTRRVALGEITMVSPSVSSIRSPSTSTVARPDIAVQICSTSNTCSGPAWAARMSTRHSDRPAAPSVGEASVVITALGVSVRRALEAGIRVIERLS